MWLNRFGGLVFAEIQQDTKYHAKYCERLDGQCLFCGTLYGTDRPKWQTTEEYYEKEGMEIVIVLDGVAEHAGGGCKS